MAISKNTEFAQMQGVEKILMRHIHWYVSRNFFHNTAVEMKSEFLEVAK